MQGAIATGWGIAVPDKVLTNADLSARLDTTDEWITERTGIKERHIGGTTSGLAIEAGREALRRAGREASEIDLLVLATTTPDAIVPGTSATVQNGLGIAGGAMDLNAACSGFVYALVAAHGFILAGARRVLVIGAETLSRITDWDDRRLAVIVGDGAGALVLEATDGPGELLAWDLGADGSLRNLLYCEHGGYLFMDGTKMTPPVAVGVLLLLLFNGQRGAVNTVLGWFGIPGPAWTTDPLWVKPGLVIMGLWTVGSTVIILLAALRAVPGDLYDAARVDGAGFWNRTRAVTLPMISGPLFFVVVVNTIGSLQMFTEAYTAYFGSGNTTYSNDAALFYVIYLFQQAFQFLHMGYASALAWLLFAVIMAITGIQVLVSRRLVYYEGDR